MSGNSPFGKSAKTTRSPTLNDCNMLQISQHTQQQDDQDRLKKRKHNELNDEENKDHEKIISNNDIYDLIMQKSAQDSNERNLIKEEITREIRSINEKIKKLEENVQAIDAKVDNVSALAQQNSKLINSLYQDKIDKCMEIDGLQRNIIEECQDLKTLALETIESFKIKIDALDIERVIKRDIPMKESNGVRGSKALLIVHFKDFDTKLRVLRGRRGIKDIRGIYFNTSLTASNRSMMTRAKKIAIKKNLKVFFKNSKVHVEKENKSLMVIECDKDLNELEKYVESLHQTDTPQFSSNNKD